MNTTTVRKHFPLPLQPAVADAHGYVVADMRDEDPKADIKQYVVCAPCRVKALDEYNMSQLHETPVGPSDRCQMCEHVFRGSAPTVS